MPRNFRPASPPATEYPKQARTAYTVNYDVAPGPVNTPVIFEPASDLAMSVPQVWIAASGGANWGGCSVHLSVDGITYARIGQIATPARLGVLTAAIGAVADPDTTSTPVGQPRRDAGRHPAERHPGRRRRITHIDLCGRRVDGL